MRKLNNHNTNNNVFAEAFRIMAISLYQVVMLIITFTVIGGKALFDFLHKKLVKP